MVATLVMPKAPKPQPQTLSGGSRKRGNDTPNCVMTDEKREYWNKLMQNFRPLDNPVG